MKNALIEEKFRENYKYLNEFADEFLVVCPKCDNRAKVILAETVEFNPANHLFSARKLICPNCGFNKIKDSKSNFGILFSNKKTNFDCLVIGGAFDWYFQETLWLQRECGGKTLWAMNERHLEFIENYVAAKIRARTPNVNQSIASRLPQWIKSAKNRDEILKTIEKLKEKT